ncbi:uncharacterized protein LAESUDRAFT_641630 [Laetiporus sulphureus 93-53]|uniref:BTB domain-containing protein n=1 Tax=Laetiporus sulphureus 93-53 TaxID=1314785 RepID=A0A165HLE8_9APHY|nr:uncharacterized protein LAESUDRAFT_641630 [Laetiporus sulphureus 93-53]KZT11883.1 hypothetical protein LAESUDRAFT_641630 [Laetiporus sulphureus 93-53]
MFSLPEADNVDGKSAQEGSGDGRPICLYGDTADDFRTFLSIMYALPSELQMYNSPDADISKLLIVASITNKYHFVSTSSWAVSAVYSVTSGAYGSPTDPLADLTRVSSSALTRILEVAIRCGHSRLVDYVVECWSNRILNRGLKPRIAIHLADRWGIDSLRGVAYYVQLMQIGSVFEARMNGTANESSHSPSGDHSAEVGNTSPSGEEYDDSEDDEESRFPLTQAQLTRLLSGFYSLVALWDKVRAAPPKFVRPEGCTFHNHGCLAVFRDEWTAAARHERTQRYGSADIVGRLRCMEEQMRTNTELACQLSPMCRKEALAAVKALVKEVQEGLAARFVDLTSRFR